MSQDIKIMIETILNDKQFKSGLKSMETTTKKSTGIMQQTLGNVKVGFLAVVGAVRVVVGALSGSIKAFNQQEQADRKLATSLKSVGDESKKTFRSMQDFASIMQKQTGVADDAVENLISLGLQMGISTDKIQDATKGAIGLSKAFGIDLNSSMKMVALANEGQYEMLGRYIPELRTATTDAEKLSIVQKGMANGFKVATDQMQSQTGKVDNMKNVIGDFAEIVGKAALTLAGPVIKGITAIVSKFNEWFGSSTDMDDITLQLIKNQTEYKDVVDKLAKSQGKLSDEEERGLKTRKAQLELDSAKLIERVSRAYNKATRGFIENTGELERNRKASEEAQKAYNVLTQIQERGMNPALKKYVATAKEYQIVTGLAKFETDDWIISEKKLNELIVKNNQKLVEANAKAESSNKSFYDGLTELATAVKNGTVDIRILRSANSELADEVLKLVPTIKEQGSVIADSAKGAGDTVNETVATTKGTMEEYLEFMGMQKEKELLKLEENYEKQKQFAIDNNKSLLDVQNQYISEAEKIRNKYDEKMIKKDEEEKKRALDLQEFKQGLIRTGVDAVIDGIADEKKAGKKATADVIKMIGTQIAAELAAKALAAFAIPLGLGIPSGIAYTAAAAGVKVISNQAANQIASFDVGTPSVQGDQVAQIHDGERIIPAAMNIPGISNEAMMAATYRGIGSQPMQPTASNISNDNSMNINFGGIQLNAGMNTTIGDLMNMADRMGIKSVFQRG